MSSLQNATGPRFQEACSGGVSAPAELYGDLDTDARSIIIHRSRLSLKPPASTTGALPAGRTPDNNRLVNKSQATLRPLRPAPERPYLGLAMAGRTSYPEFRQGRTEILYRPAKADDRYSGSGRKGGGWKHHGTVQAMRVLERENGN